MTILEFQENYGTEEQCREYLKASRWPDGFECPKCQHKAYYNTQSRGLYHCKSCEYQCSVTAGTIFDKTRTPLVKWFMAIYLMGEDKRGISALALKKKIGVSYTTAWTMLQKIRHAMGERDANYYLSGIVELDEAFFGAPTDGGKRGRGTDKTPVLVSVSLTEDGKPNRVCMEVVDNVDSETVADFAEDNVANGTQIRTDGLKVYSGLAGMGYALTQKKYEPKKQPTHLHWLHIIISNAKAFIDGTYHGLDKKHLQRYLDEFCYRFNRRWFASGIFPRLLDACASTCKISYRELVG